MLIGSGLIKVRQSWSAFKAIVYAKEMLAQYDDLGSSYEIFAIDGPVVYVTELVKDGGADVTEFDDDYKPHANKVLSRHQSDGSVSSVPAPREGEEVLKVSVNLCDPCTWYCASSRHTGVTLTNTGDGLTWNAVGHVNLIDLEHGRLFNEHKYRADYEVKVYVYGVLQISGYTVNYENGTVTFSESKAGAAVTTDFSKATTSCWPLIPDEGRVIRIEDAWVQFTDDIPDTFADTPILFEYRVGEPPGYTAYVIAEYRSRKQLFDECVEVNEWTSQGVKFHKLKMVYRTMATVPHQSIEGSWVWIGLGGNGSTPVPGTRATGSLSGTAVELEE